jgi:hypothetical protein
MLTRILSRVVGRGLTLAATIALLTFHCVTACGQGAGYHTDPATGIVYQQITRTIERPVVETRIDQREETVYRPQTVTETRPETRSVYEPVVEYKWEPRLQGWWNPFQQPTVAYHHVPRTNWKLRQEVVQRTQTRTEWVAEKRTIEIPQKIVRIQREQKVDYEPVGQVAGGNAALVSRLRPLDPGTAVQPLGNSTHAAPRLAASTVGSVPGSSNQRSPSQTGVPATELYPSSGTVYGQPLPPATTGIATLPPAPIFR